MKHRQTHKLRWLLCLLVAVGLGGGWAGCGDDPPAEQPAKEQPAPDKKDTPKKAPTKKADAKKDDKGDKGDEASKEYKRPDIPANSRRDPFVYVPPIPEEEKDIVPRTVEPLEQFELSQLSLVAIITGTPVTKAMFLDPTKFGHIAKEGDRIGKDGGRITDIRTNEVEVTINPLNAADTADDLQEDGEPAATREGGEPVTVVIRLTDTDIVLPDSEVDQDDRKTVVEQLDAQNRPATGGRSATP